jgi:hypothetical protein
VIRLSDTSPDVEARLREVLRQMPFARKWHRLGSLYDTAQALHAAGFRARHPAATVAEIEADWRTNFREGPRLHGRNHRMLGPNENLVVVEEVIAVLTKLGIPYAIGGSWASSLFGKMRFTHDADLTAEPFPKKEAVFCASFGEDYYISQIAVEEAIQRRSSFNILHITSGFKVDVFIRKERAFDQSIMARRRPYPLEGKEVVLVSPEDVILLKLEWYRIGGESSERQWSDVLGVFQVQEDKLDQSYLDRWAADLGVTDLLQRARQEVAL